MEHSLNPLQYGFRSKHSTVKQLFVFLQFTFKFDENIDQVVVYLDFSKAFDSVDHSNLLLKLARFGFDKSFVSFLFSYLSDRLQRVNLVGFLSDKLPVTSGVPQG